LQTEEEEGPTGDQFTEKHEERIKKIYQSVLRRKGLLRLGRKERNSEKGVSRHTREWQWKNQRESLGKLHSPKIKRIEHQREGGIFWGEIVQFSFPNDDVC